MVAVDNFALVLANMNGYTGTMAPIVGAALKPWFFATVFFVILAIILLVVIILVGNKTNGFKELKASMSGKRICLFFDDTRNVEMKTLSPSAGTVFDETYGTFVVHEEGAYVDKKTRNIYMCFNTNQAMGASVKHFNAAHKLTYILGDQKRLQTLNLAMANGEFVDIDFDCLKTNINFSTLKSFSNTMLPHNISAKINMEIAERMKSYGSGGNASQIMWFFLVGLALVGLMALVLYLTLGGKSGGGTTIIQSGLQTASNMTGLSG